MRRLEQVTIDDLCRQAEALGIRSEARQDLDYAI